MSIHPGIGLNIKGRIFYNFSFEQGDRLEAIERERRGVKKVSPSRENQNSTR